MESLNTLPTPKNDIDGWPMIYDDFYSLDGIPLLDDIDETPFNSIDPLPVPRPDNRGLDYLRLNGEVFLKMFYRVISVILLY